ncbi:MAG: DNA pilot protein [Arizlama microvirus]|nr:MAG: DNA pilot protein [Arizlama microvirus]
MGLFDFVKDSIGSIGGALVGGLFGSSGQKSANKTNIKLAREQMDFQERMSSTAYQRAVADMQSAGLNPMLAYSQGGASAPMGSMPTVQNEGSAGVSSASQAMGVVQSMQSVAQSKAATERLQAETDKIRSETLPNLMHVNALRQRTERDFASSSLALQQQLTEAQRAGLVRNQAQFTKVMEGLRSLDTKRGEATFDADVRIRKAEALLRELGIPQARAGADFYSSDLGELNPYLRQLLEAAKGITSGIGAVRR